MFQRSRFWVGYAVLAMCVAPLWAADESDAKKESVTPADLEAVVKAVAPALVVIEYTLRYDQGEPPEGSGGYRGGYGQYASYGGYSGMAAFSGSFGIGGLIGGMAGGIAGGSELIKQERPFELPGCLLSPTQVLSFDLGLHPRFIERIVVRQGEQRVAAKVSLIGLDRPAMILELAEPLTGAQPLKFGSKQKQRFAISYSLANTLWTTGVAPIGKAAAEHHALAIDERGRRYAGAFAPPGTLIVDKSGTGVGVVMKMRRNADEAWQGSPLQWPWITNDALQDALKALENAAEQMILRVKLNLRSPPKGADGYGRYFGGGWGGNAGEVGEDETERTVAGILVGPETVLVLATLPPKVTARLERMIVHTSDGRDVEAKFERSLKDYGALIAKLVEPLDDPVVIKDGEVLDLQGSLLLGVEVRVQGQRRVTYFNHTRLDHFMLGHRRQVFPLGGYGRGMKFIFDRTGRLAAIPMTRRQKVSVREEYSYSQPMLVPAIYLADILADPGQHDDPNNVPLTEQQQNRLAWIGVELQALNPELARINNVSHLTQDGRIGAMVTYVYPDSPADKAGIEMGDFLIRLTIEGEPKPLEVKIQDRGGFSMGDFPWAQFDSMPVEYFEHMPTPWPAAENPFTRALTDLGFGRKFTAELARDGKTFHKPFVVEQSPPHYKAAPKFKSESLGMTVRDLTYEVRRLLQKSPDDAGLVVSKVESGKKAAVAGIRPYELITQINGEPVSSVKQFEQMINDQTEVRLTVERLREGRTVKIKLAAKAK